MMRATILGAVTAISLTGCGSPSESEKAAAATSTVQPAAPEPAEEPIATISDTDLGRVCRGAVAALNGRDPAIIKVEQIENGVAYVGYERPDDGKVWKNRCRVDGDRVIWASVDLDGPGSGPGRWRTHADDEIVTYALDGPTVKVRIGYGDGSGSEEAYSIK
ncbi:MAG: hypothetical protein U1E06_08365 [Tabrizicola sp.]|jgi:hypothetical protein|nr:hypothetical protein [Tabrizicola sp.]